MAEIDTQPIMMVAENEAQGDVVALFDEIKRVMQIPNVPNSARILAVSPQAASIYWAMYKTMHAETTLPESLISMIGYAIAHRNHCQYCTSINELSCRILGIEEETMEMLVDDLENVNPERVRAIIQFALLATGYPHSVGESDFNRLRELGVSDAEIIEIVLIAAIMTLNNILSDVLKIPVDDAVQEALGR